MSDRVKSWRRTPITSRVELVLASAVMRDAFEEVELAVHFGVSTILLAGESGVGKEHLARFVHRRANGPDEPFVSIDCAAAAREHRSSFAPRPAEWLTRALPERSGTIFLKGVHHLTPPLQMDLLRLLESTRELNDRAAGGDARPVRIICSGLAFLSQTLSSGAFHRELYYRLNTLYVSIPPLRERRDEVDPLLRYFVDLAAREQGLPSPAFSSEWPAMFDGYDWPGNVRELRTVAESIVARAGYMADAPFARVH